MRKFFSFNRSSLRSVMSDQQEVLATQQLAVCQLCKGPALEARLLPCLHTICSPCLEKLIRHHARDRKAGCPTCKVRITDVEDPNDLKLNKLALMLREKNEKELKKQGQTCTACVLDGKEKDKQASLWCTVCKEYFCDKCNKVHQQVQPDKKVHEVIKMSTLRKQGLTGVLKKDKEFCEEHKKEILKFFCNKCSLAICVSCDVADHFDHDKIPIADAAGNHREEIKENVASTESKFALVGEAIEAWAEYEKEIDEAEKSTLEDIDEYANELISLVQSWHKQCLNTLHSAIEKERDEIETRRESYSALKTSFETAMMYSDRLVTQGKDSHIANVKQQVIQRLNELCEINLKKPGSNLAFSFQHTPEIDTAKTFGTLYVEQEDKISTDSSSIGGFDTSFGRKGRADIGEVRSFQVNAITDRLEPWITGVNCTKEGQIIVADHRNNVIKLYDDKGKFQQNIFVNQTLVGKKRFDGPSQSLWDCAWLPDGSIVTASVDGLHIFNINSEVVNVLDSDSEYTSVTVTHKGEVVSYNDTKGLVTIHDHSTGVKIKAFPVYEKHSIGWISKVAIDNSGNILLCDVKNDCVKTFSAVGRLLSQIGRHGKNTGEFIRLRGVCCDIEGNLIVCDKGNHRIQKISNKGVFIKCLMTKADGLDSPSSVVMYDKEKVIVVTDKGVVHIVKVN